MHVYINTKESVSGSGSLSCRSFKELYSSHGRRLVDNFCGYRGCKQHRNPHNAICLFQIPKCYRFSLRASGIVCLKQHGKQHCCNTDTTCNDTFVETTPFETYIYIYMHIDRYIYIYIYTHTYT